MTNQRPESCDKACNIVDEMLDEFTVDSQMEIAGRPKGSVVEDRFAGGRRSSSRILLLNKEDRNMRSAFDFSPFRRSTIGFDRLFDMLEESTVGSSENYPPFDLVMVGDDEYRIDLAVAGFSRDDIEITAQQNQLIVKGKRTDEDGTEYVHRGIATREFERRFGLADHIRVTDADLHDGLLSISLVREIPEAMKPRTIDIGCNRAIDAKAKEDA